MQTPGASESAAPLNLVSTGDRDELETGLFILDTAIDELWSGRGSMDTGLLKLNRAAALFETVSDKAAAWYLLARVELYRGRYVLFEKNKSVARSHFELSMDLAQQSLSIRESSEAYRVLADAASSWMITKGLGAIIRMAPRVQEWSDAALELDPLNPLALIINLQGQINAPRTAGGDPEKAELRLKELHSRENLSDVELFWTRLSLSQVYNKLKNRDNSELWLRRAKEIFPDNPMLENAGR